MSRQVALSRSLHHSDEYPSLELLIAPREQGPGLLSVVGLTTAAGNQGSLDTCQLPLLLAMCFRLLCEPLSSYHIDFGQGAA